MERNVKSRNLAEGTVKIRTFNNTLSSCGDPWFIFICMCTTSKKKKKEEEEEEALTSLSISSSSVQDRRNKKENVA